MAFLTVVVQDEHCNAISEEVVVTSNVLPDFDDQRFICLRFIDPYGDTVFNCLQIPVVLEELDTVERASDDPQVKATIKKIKELAQTCQKEPHQYLRFIGD
jgi:hypothetical protein